MKITEKEQDQVMIVSVEGEIDASTAETLTAAFNKITDQGKYKLIGDFEKVDYMSSAGLRVLLSVMKETRAKGGDLRLAAVQKDVFKVLKMSGFDRFLKFYDDTETAVINYYG